MPKDDHTAGETEDDAPAADSGAGSVPDPRATDHPTGGDQAADNAENEPAG